MLKKFDMFTCLTFKISPQTLWNPNNHAQQNIVFGICS